MKILIDTEKELVEILTKESHNTILQLADIIEKALYTFPVLASEVTDIPENVLEEYELEGKPIDIVVKEGNEVRSCDIMPKSSSNEDKN